MATTDRRPQRPRPGAQQYRAQTCPRHDAFTGTALARVLILDRPVDHTYGERLVELIVNGLAPR